MVAGASNAETPAIEASLGEPPSLAEPLVNVQCQLPGEQLLCWLRSSFGQLAEQQRADADAFKLRLDALDSACSALRVAPAAPASSEDMAGAVNAAVSSAGIGSNAPEDLGGSVNAGVDALQKIQVLTEEMQTLSERVAGVETVSQHLEASSRADTTLTDRDDVLQALSERLTQAETSLASLQGSRSVMTADLELPAALQELPRHADNSDELVNAVEASSQASQEALAKVNALADELREQGGLQELRNRLEALQQVITNDRDVCAEAGSKVAPCEAVPASEQASSKELDAISALALRIDALEASSIGQTTVDMCSARPFVTLEEQPDSRAAASSPLDEIEARVGRLASKDATDAVAEGGATTVIEAVDRVREKANQLAQQLDDDVSSGERPIHGRVASLEGRIESMAEQLESFMRQHRTSLTAGLAAPQTSAGPAAPSLVLPPSPPSKPAPSPSNAQFESKLQKVTAELEKLKGAIGNLQSQVQQQIANAPTLTGKAIDELDKRTETRLTTVWAELIQHTQSAATRADALERGLVERFERQESSLKNVVKQLDGNKKDGGSIGHLQKQLEWIVWRVTWLEWATGGEQRSFGRPLDHKALQPPPGTVSATAFQQPITEDVELWARDPRTLGPQRLRRAPVKTTRAHLGGRPQTAQGGGGAPGTSQSTGRLPTLGT
jgi:tetrahydromethanopterin S-methyltransferase subunit B